MARYSTIVFALAGLALAGPLAAQTADTPPPAAAPAQNAAEIAFWTSVKDSKNPAELRAYLTAFPAGLFSQLARLRLEDLEKPQPIAAPAPAAAAAPTPAPAPPAPARAPVAANPSAAVDLSGADLIREVQLKLYALNYDPDRVDGVMTAATRTAIREWQKNINVPVTGNFTEETLKRLRDARANPTWAAVAYTARGASGWVFNRPSRAEAEQQAVDLCVKQAGRGSTCKPITASGSACITMASFTTKRGTTTYFGSHVSLQPNQTASISEALRLCGEAENNGGNCSARVTICADGSHKK